MEPVRGIPLASLAPDRNAVVAALIAASRQEVIDEVNRILVDNNIKFLIDDEGYVDIDPT